MHFPSKRLLDLWSKAKHVEIATSFDGVGNVIEYVRYPTSWDIAKENIIKYMELSKQMNVRVGMRSTIMIYNILNLPDMTTWWISKVNKHYKEKFNETSWFNPTHVAQPKFLSIKVLPPKAKEIVTKKLWNKGKNNKVKQNFNHFCNYMNSEDHSFLLDEFRLFTKSLDSSRSTSFKSICPELYNEIF
jgi:glutamate-1-semialdehyde 2,1-aminomutase